MPLSVVEVAVVRHYRHAVGSGGLGVEDVFVVLSEKLDERFLFAVHRAVCW